MLELVTDKTTSEPKVGAPVSVTAMKMNNLFPDFNAIGMGKAVTKIEENRRLRRNKFPSLKGSYGCDFVTEDGDINNGFSKRNDEKDLQHMAPHRIYDSLVDPTSGFLSAGCHGWQTQMNHLNDMPQSIPATSKYQILLEPASRQLKRQSTWCPGSQTAWNSRKKSDVWVQAKIHSWINDVETRRVEDIKRLPKTAQLRGQAQNIQDKLAIKFIYGTSTQRGYKDVPWNSILRPRQCPPTLTGEERSDIVLYHKNKILCKPNIQESQAEGYSSSGQYFSTSPYYKRGPALLSHPGNQIQQCPLYSGSVNAKKFTEAEKFEPSMMRISSALQPSQETQKFANRPHSEYRRKSRMSKMVTLVPPYNPFNNVEKVPVLV